MAAMISEGVTQPGTTGTWCSTHQDATSPSKPGVTMNLAPSSTACLHWSRVMTVPAPTSISGHCSAMMRMASGAAWVRNVISITSTPPASMALAVGSAWDASSITTTGAMPASPILCKTSIKLPPYPFARRRDLRLIHQPCPYHTSSGGAPSTETRTKFPAEGP